MAKNEFVELKDEVESLKETVMKLGKETVRIGTILPYGGSAEPNDGWLFCDGRALRRDDYPDLYHVIGTNFGTPDAAHFNLPDLRGRFVRGVDHGAGRDPDASSRGEPQKSGNEGDAVGSVQEEEFKQHRHKYDRFYNNQGGGFLSGSGRGLIESGVETDYKEDTSKAFSPKKKDLTPPGGTETRPKNIYVEWIIYAGKKKKG
jgi:hypothetical protein